MAQFVLDIDEENISQTNGRGRMLQLSDEALWINAAWFVSLRWFVVAFLVIYGSISFFFSETLEDFGVKPNALWSIEIGITLLLGNIIFLVCCTSPRIKEYLTVSVILWAQIIFDLLCLTVVVHFVGSSWSPAPSLYIIHVALACVFFSVRSSLAIALLANFMYLLCVSAETGGG